MVAISTKMQRAPTCPILGSENHFSMLQTIKIEVMQNMMASTITPEKLLAEVQASTPNTEI